MERLIIEFLQRFDIQNIISIAMMFWFFYKRINKKFDKVDLDLKDIRNEIKDIRSEIKEMRTSLNRIEGAFYSKDCCMLKEDRKLEKAE